MAKKSPTLRDIDFVAKHGERIGVPTVIYNELVLTLEGDCDVLRQIGTTDYSLLVGIRYLIDDSTPEQYPMPPFDEDGRVNL